MSSPSFMAGTALSFPLALTATPGSEYGCCWPLIILGVNTPLNCLSL